MHTTNTRICQTLASLESDFFLALQNGSEALTLFDRAWLTFTTEVESCIDQLDEKTRAKIFAFAETANIVALNLLEVDDAGENLHVQLRQEMMKILREEFNNLSIRDTTASIGGAAHIPAACQWLLENLHNPYPSREKRLEISKSTSSSMKDVDAWFTDARKHIGWNQLRKDHFPKRGDLIKAATRFFKQSQSAIPVSKALRSTAAADQYLDFSLQFVQIEEYAKERYSSKYVPSEFAAELEKTEPLTAENMGVSGQEWPGRGRYGLKTKQQSAYPSPEYSPGPNSRSLSPSSRPTPLHDTIHSELANRKRKRSISPTDTLSEVEEIEQPASRTVKRRRVNAKGSLPSPATSVLDSLPVELRPLSPVLMSPIIPAQTFGKRKRALSDVDDRAQKRPHIITRSQSIQCSDPVRPAERLAELNIEDLIVDVFGLNNEYAYGADPVTSPSFDDINQFGVEFHYNFPYDVMIGNGPGREESESPGDTPELESIALPQPQLTSPSSVNDMPAFDVENVIPNYDVPLPWSSFDMPPGNEYWLAEQVLTNSTNMLASGWSDDCVPIGLESLPPQTFWSSPDTFPNNANDYCNLPTTSPGTLFSDVTTIKTPEQLLYDDKRQKINQLNEMLAKVEVLRSELAL